MDTRFWAARQVVLDQRQHELLVAGREAVRVRDHELAKAETAMNGLNPERPLEKGFCLVQSARTGNYIRDARDVLRGDLLRIVPRFGAIDARVEEIRTERGE